MKEKIENLIKDVLKNLGIPASTQGGNEDVTFSIEHPEDFKNGDYSTNVAMVCAKKLGMNSNELAEKIKTELEKNLSKEVEKIEVAGAGFINFYLSREFFTKSIDEILKQGENWGKNELGSGQKIIVEYSSPNIAKPFTVGHLRSTIIGDSISRILFFSGSEVIRDNHLGDWGTQFGKLIVAIKKWGNLSQIEKSEKPIKELVSLYVKFHEEAEKDTSLEDEAREYFSKLEKKDEEVVDIWKRCIELSKNEFERIYKKLNVSKFDTEHGESFFEDKMSEVLEDVKEKNIVKESEGAFIIEFDEHKKLPPLLLLKKDGSSLYGLRDLATDRWRKEEYGNEIKIINEVGGEQIEYFKQIFQAEEMLGYFTKEKRKHVFHGLYRFKDGKMSTRKGNAIWLEDIIDEAEKRAGVINEESKEKVAIGALKFNDLKRDSAKDIIFDWEEILNIKGDSGAYLQYGAVRANSILEKSKAFNLNGKDAIPVEINEIEKVLHRFPEIVEHSYQNLAPQYIAIYLLQVASLFNNFYGNNQILKEENNYMNYHLKLVKAFYQTMKNGLWLLGIEVPERM